MKAKLCYSVQFLPQISDYRSKSANDPLVDILREVRDLSMSIRYLECCLGFAQIEELDDNQVSSTCLKESALLKQKE